MTIFDKIVEVLTEMPSKDSRKTNETSLPKSMNYMKAKDKLQKECEKQTHNDCVSQSQIVQEHQSQKLYGTESLKECTAQSHKATEAEPRDTNADRSQKATEGESRDASTDQSQKATEGESRDASTDQSRKNAESESKGSRKAQKVCEGRITSPFGMRHDPINKLWREHNGVDISAVVGTPVLSPCNGQVAAVFSNAAGGKTLILNSADSNHRFAFCHLSDFKVAPLEVVVKGQLIALTGNTGRSTGPHLHFSAMTDGKWIDGVYAGGRYVNPEPFIKL